MNWIASFLKSSLGKKVIMSLTGLFLCLFLVIHLLGNLQLLKNDGGMAFNTYTYFMTHNPLIKVVSYITYAFILLHSIQGILLYFENKKSRPTGYAKKNSPGNTFASRNMALLGSFIFIFLGVHMGDFWLKMKRGVLDMVSYEGYDHIWNLYSRVDLAYKEWWIVLFYVLSMILLAYHLRHGFQSAFQSLGFSHPKYTPIIKGIGNLFSVLIPIGFAIIPIIRYFFFN
ncbi:MAG: succinate dehydrogenase cytochrome b subunit [Saprospiraceae bacterium]